MNLLPDEQENAIIDTLRQQAGRWFPLDATATGLAAAPWRQAIDAGWLTLGLPAELGGTGLGLAGDALLFRELGRQLVPGPALATIVAHRLAMRSRWDGVAARLASGEVRMGLTLPAAHALPGEQILVLDGGQADLALQVTGRSARVFEVLAVLDERRTIDQSQPVAVVRARTTEYEVQDDHGQAQTQLRVLVAALASGICEATLSRSTAYAKLRTQFGRPIGAFQAVSHRCASMATRAEVAWMQTLVAALSVTDNPEQAAAEAASARLLAVDYAIMNCSDNIQNHGGIGFTTEVAEHRFLKRARTLDNLEHDRRALTDTLLSGRHRTSDLGPGEG